MEYKLEIISNVGPPHNYHHFIVDVLFPFFARTFGKERSKVYIPESRTIGNFTKHFEQFFGIPVEIVGDNTFNKLECRKIKLISMRLISPTALNYVHLRNYSNRVFKLEDESYPKTLLIERVARHKDSGANRRKIGNHNELATFLHDKFNCKNIVLEDMPFLEQIKHFYNATLVFGQHGAGLSNMIWMKENSRVVEFTSYEGNSAWWLPYIRNKKIKWQNIKCRSTGGHRSNTTIFVNIKDII